MEQKTSNAPRAPTTGDWLTDTALQPLLEINVQCIEMLREMASRRDPGAGQAAVVNELRSLWLGLSADTILQMAACPFLLVDAGFNDEARWRALQKSSVHDTPRDTASSCFGAELSAAFSRRVLTYGWHLARAHAQVARVALGMSPNCARSIGSLSLRDLDWVSEQQPGWVRLRWESQPVIWRQFLNAAVNNDRTALQHMSLRGIQLMGAGALGRT
ncbi:MAG: hypothetical protein ABI859_13570 [Pseudomonadota bacterium]